MHLARGSASRLRSYVYGGSGLEFLERFGISGSALRRDRLLIEATAKLLPHHRMSADLAQALDTLQTEIGELCDVLILRTDWYKASLGAGFVRSQDGEVRFVKVFPSCADAERQVHLMDALRPLLPPAVRFPSGVSVVRSVLVTDAVEGGMAGALETATLARHLGQTSSELTEGPQWRMDVGVSGLRHALGEVVGADAGERVLRLIERVSGVPTALAHGDFVPWNLIRADDGYVLVDIEESGFYPEYFDLAHCLLQPAALRGGHVPRHLSAHFPASHDGDRARACWVAALAVEIVRCAAAWSQFPRNRRMASRMLRTHVSSVTALDDEAL